MKELHDAGLAASKAGEYEKAAAYYTLAAEQGGASPQNNLAILYEEGLGVDQSLETALEYDLKAADDGDTRAVELLTELV